MAERKRKTEQAEVEGKAAAAKEEAAVADAEARDEAVGGGQRAEESEAAAEGAEEQPKKPARRRRGSAETSTGTETTRKRRPEGEIVVRARAKYVRSAPRKARLVMDHIRGRPVEQALAVLTHTPRSASADILKLLNSAVANAEANYELGADELKVQRAYVDEGPTIKRYRPRALGRATRINKRTSHMTIELIYGEKR